MQMVRPFLENIALGLACSISFLAFVTLCLGQFDHNDFMYTSASSMSGVLYKDIHFLQAPLSFYFLKSLTWLSPAGHAYFVMRLSSIILTSLSLLIPAYACFENKWARTIFLLIGTTSYFLVCGAFEIGSYAVPLFFLAVATAIAYRTFESQKHAGALLFGLFLGLAASAKLNHVFFLVPAAFFCQFFWSNTRSKRHHTLVYFCLGALIGLAPIFFELLKQPLAFILHNISFHAQIARPARGLDFIQSLKSIFYILHLWMVGGGAILLAICMSAIVAYRYLEREKRALVILNALMALTALLVAFVPGAGYKQYYIPASFFVILGACWVIETRLSAEPTRIIICAALFSVLLIQTFGLVSMVKTSIYRGSTVAEVERINRIVARDLAQFAPTQACKPEIFSFIGAFVIDSGFPLSRYSEAGIFWATKDGFVPAQYFKNPAYQLPHYLVRPDLFVADQNIKIVLLGYYPQTEAEKRLRIWLEHRGYVSQEIKTSLVDSGLELWIDPVCLRSGAPS